MENLKRKHLKSDIQKPRVQMAKKQEEMLPELAVFRKKVEVKHQTMSEMANKLKCSQGRLDLNENLIKGLKKFRKTNMIIKVR